MILDFNEKFTLGVPTTDDEILEIKGTVAPDTPQLKKLIKEKYKDRDKLAKENKKKSDTVARNRQKAENIEERLKYVDDSKKYALLEEQQNLLDVAYKLADELNESLEDDFDILEVVSKEHIERRVSIEDKDSKLFNDICEEYGYKLVWETILKDINEGKQKDKKN